MLHLARAILALRRESPALHRGTLTLLDDAPDGVLAYERAEGGDRRRVWVNFGSEPVAPAEGWVRGAGDGRRRRRPAGGRARRSCARASPGTPNVGLPPQEG